MHVFNCVKCGTKEEIIFFDSNHGGLLCRKCAMAYKINRRVSQTLVYTLQYILSSPVNALFSFKLEDTYLSELEDIANRFRRTYVDKEFKSLEILSSLDVN